MQTDADDSASIDDIEPEANHLEFPQSTDGSSVKSTKKNGKSNANDKTASSNDTSTDQSILIEDEPLNLSICNRTSKTSKELNTQDNDKPLDLSLKV